MSHIKYFIANIGISFYTHKWKNCTSILYICQLYICTLYGEVKNLTYIKLFCNCASLLSPIIKIQVVNQCFLALQLLAVYDTIMFCSSRCILLCRIGHIYQIFYYTNISISTSGEATHKNEEYKHHLHIWRI